MHPNLRFAGPASSCWTISPYFQCAGQELNLQSPKAGGLQPLGLANAQPTHEREPWDSNPQASFRQPPVFETGSSSSRMTPGVGLGGFRLQASGLKKESQVLHPRSRRAFPVIHKDLPPSLRDPRDPPTASQLRGLELNQRPPVSKTGIGYQHRIPRNGSSRPLTSGASGCGGWN